MNPMELHTEELAGKKAKKAKQTHAGKDEQTAAKDSLRLYYKQIDRYPVLTAEQEEELARRAVEQEDTKARFRLVTSHLRLVVKIAGSFQRRFRENMLDLIQEGNMGLMRAAEKFDPERGVRFGLYATYWIKAHMRKYIMDNWRLVKLGTNQKQRKLFYNLKREQDRIRATGEEPRVEVLAEQLDVDVQDVLDMDGRLRGPDMSLNRPVSDDSATMYMELLPSNDEPTENSVLRRQMSGIIQQRIEEFLPRLDGKERDILQQRLLTEKSTTLREIGERHGVTRERIRQVEARLKIKLQDHLNEESLEGVH
jgi:RNA polymerase sigma-32 factor